MLHYASTEAPLSRTLQHKDYIVNRFSNQHSHDSNESNLSLDVGIDFAWPTTMASISSTRMQTLGRDLGIPAREPIGYKISNE